MNRIKETLKKRGVILILRGAVLAMWLFVLVVCVFGVIPLSNEWAQDFPDIAYLQYPIVVGVYVSAIFFFVALFQAMKLLSYIDHGKAFSELSVQALKYIKYCAIVIWALYSLNMFVVYRMTQQMDAPGFMFIGMIIPFASFVIAVFASLLQKILHDAIVLKSENDLTV